MYTQALNTSDGEDRHIEDVEHAARFQARIDAEERIEPNDWMPAAYRKTLTRQISQHAHSEIVGMLPEGNWITRAPIAAPQGRAARKGAGRVRARALSLRRRRDARRLPRGARRCHARGQGQIFLDLQLSDLTWADIGAIGWLVDGAAIMNQIPLCRCSYGPYARAMIRVCKEESSTSARATRSCSRSAAAARSRRRWRRMR